MAAVAASVRVVLFFSAYSLSASNASRSIITRGRRPARGDGRGSRGGGGGLQGGGLGGGGDGGHGETLVLLLRCLDDVETDAVDPIAEALARVLTRLERVEDGFEKRLHVGVLHLVGEGFREREEVGGAAQPDLVRPRPIAHEPELGHVRARAPVGAAGHADQHGSSAGRPTFVHGVPQPPVDVGQTPLRLGDGEAAEGQRRARDACRVDGVELGRASFTPPALSVARMSDFHAGSMSVRSRS